jgi:hypothetical protein
MAPDAGLTGVSDVARAADAAAKKGAGVVTGLYLASKAGPAWGVYGGPWLAGGCPLGAGVIGSFVGESAYDRFKGAGSSLAEQFYDLITPTGFWVGG